MYEAYFGLNKRPFASVPCIEQYFPGTAIDGALQVLTRCVQRAEGTGLVVGPSGTGKSLLCLMLAKKFQESLRVVVLSGGHLGSRRALLQAILFHLGQPYRGMDEGELRLAILDYLANGDGCPQGVLLLVDEAHVLSLRLLDELRMTTNLVARGEPCVRLVLVGGAALEERLASPKLESFSQRIAARCYLESLTREQTEGYLQSQLATAGGVVSQVFAADVAQAVFAATDGVPRLINQLCDHALLLVYSSGRRQVQSSDIEEAWADLQQLPTPWNAGSHPESAAPAVIEFGSGLDDEPDQADEQSGTLAGERSATPSGERSGSQGTLVPRLHVAGEAEEPPVDPALEPAQQVARIQQALATMDEDFQPAGAIGPEVELVFDDHSDPFAEEFEEEQVVIDRYAKLPDGRQSPLSYARQADLPLDAPAAASPPKTAAAKFAPSTVEFGSELPDSDVSVPLRSPQPVVEPEDDDLLLVVEDGYDDVDAPPTQPPVPVRRQEYRQLFARLRRSS